MDKDAVLLPGYLKEVTAGIHKEADAAAKKIKSGQDVFSGEIYDTDGILRCGAGEIITGHILIEELDWFVEGVSFLNGESEKNAGQHEEWEIPHYRQRDYICSYIGNSGIFYAVKNEAAVI